jgi:hypothetical protein
VPATALIATTRRQARKVNLSVATARGSVMSDQKPAKPSSPDRQTTAAIGMRTMTLR